MRTLERSARCPRLPLKWTPPFRETWEGSLWVVSTATIARKDAFCSVSSRSTRICIPWHRSKRRPINRVCQMIFWIVCFKVVQTSKFEVGLWTQFCAFWFVFEPMLMTFNVLKCFESEFHESSTEKKVCKFRTLSHRSSERISNLKIWRTGGTGPAGVPKFCEIISEKSLILGPGGYRPRLQPRCPRGGDRDPKSRFWRRSVYPSDFRGLVLRCIDSYDSESWLIWKLFQRSTRLTHFCTAPNSDSSNLCYFCKNLRFFFQIF